MKRTGGREKYLCYKRQVTPYILLTPILLSVSLFPFWSMINVFAMSVQEYGLLKPDERHFIGLQNFVTVFTKDRVFMKTIKNSVVQVAVGAMAQTILGFQLAYLLNQKFKGRDLYRALVLSPQAVAGVMVVITWSPIYGETFGTLNDLLLRLGLIDQNMPWPSDSTRAMTAVVIANVRRGIPFFTISYLSALVEMFDDIYESARIGGVRIIVTLFKITSLMIKDTIVITTLLRSIWTFNAVDLASTLTGGGPNNATMTMPLYIMQRSKLEYNCGYTSALAAIAGCVMMVVAFTYIRIGRLGKEEMY